MKFKTAFKYQLYSVKKSLTIYYIVIYSIILFVAALTLIQGETASFGGFEIAGAIFLFVVGLNSFKDTFHLFLANGMSRKTMFLSFTSSILPIAAGMAVIDTINSLIISLFGEYASIFNQLYHARYIGIGNAVPSAMLERLLWMVVLYASAAMVGFFITTLYYRMSKIVKVVVSVGVPVLLVIVLRFIDFTYLGARLYRMIGNFIKSMMGLNGGDNPYIAVASGLAVCALFGALSYLTMRRATVKQA